MVKFAACLVLLIGCVTEQTASTEGELHGDGDGWGEWCANPPATAGGDLYNLCANSVNGEDGICDAGVCRRQCANSLGGCPKHFHAVPLVSSKCVCEPDLRPWDASNVAPAVEW